MSRQYLYQLTKLSLILSFSGATIVTFSVRQDLHLNIIIPVLLILFYPITVVIFEVQDAQKTHLLYGLIIAASFGSILSAANSVPTGYGDVWYYIRSTQQFVNAGHVSFPTDQSGIMVGIFILSTIFSEILNKSIFYVAKILPIFTFLITVSIYFAIAKYYLSQQYRLLGLLLFFMNWGIFRFSIEFRTLNLALPILLSVVLILVKVNDGDRFGSRFVATSVVLISGLTITDFSVHFFFYAIIISFLIAWVAPSMRDRILRGQLSKQVRSKKAAVAIFILVYSAVLVYIYVEFVANRTPDIVFFAPYLSDRILSSFMYDSSVVSSTQSQGLAGKTFGNTVFILRWVLRGLFLFFGVVYLFQAINNRSVNSTWIFISGIVLGSLLIIGTVIGLPISPSRIFLFVAIPYSIVFAGGMETIQSISYFKYNNNNILKCILVLVILLAVFTSVVRFPQEIIGDTEPIRGEEPIDSVRGYKIGGEDISTVLFISENSKSGVQVSNVGLTELYIRENSNSSSLAVVDTKYYRENNNQTIYTNGKNKVYINLTQ